MAQPPYSPLLLCSICGSPAKGEHSVFVREYHRSGNRLFHFNCWQSGLSLPIRPVFSLQSEESEEVKRIVSTWNMQFAVDGALVPAIYLRKAVYTAGTPIRRLLIEVFQYLTMSEVEARAGFVSKAWFHVSRDSEYWLTRYCSDFQLISASCSDVRREYIARRLASCWGCNRRPHLYEIAWKCSYFQRPICWWCSDQPAYTVLSLHYLSTTLQVSKATLVHLSIPLFLHDSQPSCYRFHLESRVLPYAHSRRALLLTGLSTCKVPVAVVETIRKFDLGKYYGSGKVRSRVEDLLVKFCGGWREAGEQTCGSRFVRALKQGNSRRHW